MNKLKYSFLAKTLAFFLFVIVLITAFGGTLSTIYLFSEGYFDKGKNFYNSRLCSDKANEYSGNVFNYFDSLNLSKAATKAETQAAIQSMKYQFPPENSNYLFTISDESGNVLFSNYSELNSDYKMIRQRMYVNDKIVYTIDGYVRNPFPVQDDFSMNKQIFDTFYSLRYTIVIISAVSVVLSLVLAIWLISSVGYKKGREGITLSGFGLLPLDLFAAGILFGFLVLAKLPLRNPYAVNIYNEITAYVAFAGIASILVFSFILSFAARCKAGKWWENTVFFRVLKLISRFGHFLAVVFSHFSLLWKTILLYGSYVFINGILIMAFVFGSGSAKAIPFLLGLMFNFTVLAVLLAFVLHMQNLKRAGEKLADGNYDFQVDTKNMRWDFKTHGDNLNNIGQGMSKAVDARMKSERFKTELITNVSHDIKTPLTSIVNYVDLLKKEDIKDGKILEYIAVLDRQTARLQKLTEDLVEASKASTGNIAVAAVPTDLVEFVQQSVGEYTERFAANQIEAVIRKDDETTVVLADGKLLWRVFDNLLGNICKYSHGSIYRCCQGGYQILATEASRQPVRQLFHHLFESRPQSDWRRNALYIRRRTAAQIPQDPSVPLLPQYFRSMPWKLPQDLL